MKSGLLAALVAAALAVAASREPRAAAAEAFVTDNIVSNEIALQDVLPELERTHRGAYIGVGPEQNLTYITALEPSIAFVVDLQRGNMLLHLMYKALIELSADRADFLSRLFA